MKGLSSKWRKKNMPFHSRALKKKKKVQQHTREVRDKIAASKNREAEKEGDRGVGGEFLQETEN